MLLTPLRQQKIAVLCVISGMTFGIILSRGKVLTDSAFWMGNAGGALLAWLVIRLIGRNRPPKNHPQSRAEGTVSPLFFLSAIALLVGFVLLVLHFWTNSLKQSPLSVGASTPAQVLAALHQTEDAQLATRAVVACTISGDWCFGTGLIIDGLRVEDGQANLCDTRCLTRCSLNSRPADRYAIPIQRVVVIGKRRDLVGDQIVSVGGVGGVVRNGGIRDTDRLDVSAIDALFEWANDANLQRGPQRLASPQVIPADGRAVPIWSAPIASCFEEPDCEQGPRQHNQGQIVVIARAIQDDASTNEYLRCRWNPESVRRYVATGHWVATQNWLPRF